jgi:histidinol-phosphate aminotransferase
VSRLEPRADLADLAGYHSPQVDVEVRLNTNESPYPPPAAFRKAWLGALADLPLHRYPDRSARDLREALAHHLGHGPERIVCANGSNEVLLALLLAFGGPGRSMLCFVPTYTLHAHLARITGTQVHTVTRDPAWGVDPGAAVAAVRDLRPELVFLCSPNNPTGRAEPPEVVAAVADALAAHGPGLVVVDEAYGEFAPTSALGLVDDDRPLVVTRTFSKVWSLAALRLGVGIGPDWVAAAVEKVLLPYHLSAATLAAGRLALAFQAEMRARVGLIVAERERVEAALAATPGVRVHPSGANFLLFRPPGDAHRTWRRLVDAGVLVRDCSSWPGVEGHLRVTVGTPAENDRFLAALAEAVREDGRP